MSEIRDLLESMTDDELVKLAGDLTKEAKKNKSGGKKDKRTYPISRALTNPLTQAGLGGIIGAGYGGAIAGNPRIGLSGKGALVGGAIGAGLGAGGSVLGRYLHQLKKDDERNFLLKVLFPQTDRGREIMERANRGRKNVGQRLYSFER